MPKLIRQLFGKLFADKGYISQDLTRQLLEDHDLQLVTKLRSNMKNRLLEKLDKCFLRKRAILESIYDQLKNISQIEHTRHRNPIDFVSNLLGGSIAYCHQTALKQIPSDITNMRGLIKAEVANGLRGYVIYGAPRSVTSFVRPLALLAPTTYKFASDWEKALLLARDLLNKA